MLDERLHGNGTAETDGVMKGSNTIFVGGVNIRAPLQCLEESSPLGGRVRIAFATDLEEGVRHSEFHSLSLPRKCNTGASGWLVGSVHED